MTRARNIAGFSTITTTPSPVHVGPIGVLTATRIDGEFNLVDLDTRDISAQGIGVTNLQVSGITTGLNVSGIITAQNGINFNGTSTGLNVSGVSTTVTLNATTLAVSGNASIGGVLTYEDVTRVDSVGVVTAREQVHVGTGVSIAAGGLNVTAGISTFGDDVQMTGTNPEFEMNAGGPRFRVPAANTLTLHKGGGLGSTSEETIRITSSGDVGINKTPTQNDMPGVTPRLHVLGISTVGQFNTVARFESGTTDGNDTGAAVVINQTNDRGLVIQGGRGGDADGVHHANSGLGRFSIINNSGTFHKFMEAWGQNGQYIENISLFTGNEVENLRIASDGVITGRGELRLTQGTSSPGDGNEIGSLMYIFPTNDNKNAKIAALMNGGTSGADLVFYTRTQGDGTNTDGGEERVRITSGGRLGVGIDSPDELLHLKSAASAGACIELDNNGNYKSQLKTSSDELQIRGPQAINFYTGNNDGASSTIRLNIDNSGRLRINGATTTAKISMNVADGSGLGSASDGIRINSGTPNAQLVRLGSSYSYHGALGSGGASLLYSYDALRIMADTSNPITFHTGGALRMHILSNGRVYMGTTDTQQHDQNKVIVAGTKTFSAGIVQNQLTIVDENAYNTTDNGGGIGFQARYHSNGAYTQMACIQGNKENNNSADYGGTFSISTRQNNGNMIEAIKIGSAGGPVSIRSQLYCNSELNMFRSDAAASHKYFDIGYLNHVFYIRRTDGGDSGHTVHMSITSAGTIAGVFQNNSDGKLKENIASISDGSLALVKQLRPVTFDWKDSTKPNNQTGFIAQELKAVIPNLVDGEEYDENKVNEKGQIISTGYSINDIGIIAHLTKALQELSAKNDALEARIAALEGS